MPSVSTNNPTLTGGKLRRYVKVTDQTRNFRSNLQSEQHLQTLGTYLAGVDADVPSVSMLLRRAVAVYRDHMRAIAANPPLLEAEKKKVREGTILPSVGKTRRARQAERATARAEVAEAWEREAARQHAQG